MKFILFSATLLTALYVNAQVFVMPSKNVKAYSATIRAFNPASTPTDICILKGSATKVVKVIGVEVSSNQTANGVNEFHLIKRSSANTGGTLVAMSTAAWDSGNPAMTAVASSYTSNPTGFGTHDGTLLIKRAFTAASTVSSVVPFNFLDSRSMVFRPIVLRGVAESLVVSFNGMPLPSGFSINCNFEFIEE